MIQIHDGIIEMHTRSTSYILGTTNGVVENLHYGGRIEVASPLPLRSKVTAGFGGDILRTEAGPALSALCLELSGAQRGDYRRTAISARMAHGGYTSDFGYGTAVTRTGALAPAGGMPQARGECELLCVSFTESSGLTVEIFYTVFEDCDVITKKLRITNGAAKPVELRRAMSNQLDLPRCDFDLYNLQGAWARECHVTKRSLESGALTFGSTSGASSARCNPFFFLAAKDATEHVGEVYGFNLVYSGSHEGSVEVDAFGRTRVLHGVASEGFSWPLAPGESFVTPEAVMTFSGRGKNGMSQNLHAFVRGHIIPPRWNNSPRPVLVNNWEGTYFSFNEAKILKMARAAAKTGAELFVLDDGWFGQRNDDKAGLGDYTVNHKKLPGGLDGLAGKIKALGMEFGLWFEPEMVNADSDLFRAHPDWIVQTPGYIPATGRNQYVLDLCRPEVRAYIIRQVNRTLDSADISYVKWDMNRYLSDNYSPALEDQGTFSHQYVLGLYEVMEGICWQHPDILFEGCSSGGNRFDLGILSFMPQIWTSDDTDAHERQKIQTGTSYGYPLCTMGAHVSAVPNHQTLRKTPLDTRFNTAMFGLLGYELDITRLSQTELRDVTGQIEFYKKHRALLQYGDFYRLQSPFEGDSCRWMVVAPDQSAAMVGDYLGLLVPNSTVPPMRLTGLDEAALYDIQARRQKINIKSFGGLINFVLPVQVNPEGALVQAVDKVYRLNTENEHYVAHGSLLCRAGLVRMQPFSGAGYGEDLRFMADFASRVYHLRRIEQPDHNA